MMKTSNFITKFLVFNNITHIFTMSGANIEDLLSAIGKESSIKVTIVKNEYNAIMMAIGFYLKTRKIAVVLTTSGAGLLNTLSPLAEAFTSKIPLVLIAGQIPQGLEGKGGFQDNSGKSGTINILNMLRPTTGFCKKIEDVNEIKDTLESAFKTSQNIFLPSAILIPKNLFHESIDINLPNKDITTSHQETIINKKSLVEIKSPLLILGEYLLHLKDYSFIKNMAKTLDAYIALTPITKGLFNHYDQRFLGIIGIMGHDKVFEYIDKTTSILLLGTNWDLLSRYGTETLLKNKTVYYIGKNQENILNYSSFDEFRYLSLDPLQFVESFSEQNFSNQISEIKKSNEVRFDYNWEGILNLINTHLEDSADIFVDAGNTGAQCVHHLKPDGNGIFYLSLGQGGMGNSLGAAIGCSVATNKRSYVFLGDGSFLMYGLEIHTALENNLPIVIFIFNNSSHGMCSVREEIFLNEQTKINQFKKSFFADGIKAMFKDVIAFEVTNPQELVDGLKKMHRQTDKLIVFNMNINELEIPPFKLFQENIRENSECKTITVS